MNRQDAIQTLSAHLAHWERLCAENIAPISDGERTIEALKMAIEALQTDVVLCKDCIQKHIGGSITQYYWCDFWDMETDCNNGCSWGERKGGEDE